MSSLHVGLNLVYWQPDSGGAGTYARELIRALHAVEPELRLTAWVGRGAPPRDAELAPGAVDWIRLPLKSSGSPVHVAYELAALGLDARRRGVDVVHGLAYTIPAVAPGVATVVTILDLTWLHSPASVTPLARTMFRLLTAVGTRRADRVVAISEAARDDLVRTLGLPAGRIDVTPLGVVAPAATVAPAPTAVRRRLRVPDGVPLVLAVGQLTRNKNLGALVRALVSLPAGTHLVVCGKDTPVRGELERLAVGLGVRDRIVFTGFVGGGELEDLYATATCLAVPSLHEGFGLPVLEAMVRGLPVACSGIAALREVAGDAAVLFDAGDDSSVAAAIGSVLSDAALRSRLRALGLARAQEFTWNRTAEATIAAYRRALARRSA